MKQLCGYRPYQLASCLQLAITTGYYHLSIIAKYLFSNCSLGMRGAPTYHTADKLQCEFTCVSASTDTFSVQKRTILLFYLCVPASSDTFSFGAKKIYATNRA